MNFIKELPIPISGLSLGILGLGNLIQNSILKLICMLFGALILFLVISKVIFYFNIFKKDLDSLASIAVFGTFSMSLMLLSTYILNYTISFLIWIIAVLIHYTLIIAYSYKLINNFDLTNIFASSFIIYVGIGMAAITGSLYNQFIADFSFLFSFISFLIFSILVTYRYIKFPNVPIELKPLICIYSAPASLLIVAYFQCSFNKLFTLLIFLFFIALIFYIFSIVKFIQYRKQDFYPSYSSYTFPFVISASASFQIINYLFSLGFNVNYLLILAYIQFIIAILLVIYVLVGYVIFFKKKFINI